VAITTAPPFTPQGILERPGSIPFFGDDLTAGSETELQASVMGPAESVDLCRAVARSNYYANLNRRAAAGLDSPARLRDLRRYLDDNASQVWENSWVRFPYRVLSGAARATLERDLLADKRRPEAGVRSDRTRFFFLEDGDPWVRLPISYLLKLALADVLDDAPASLARTGATCLECFLSDNSSPETTSLHVVSSRSGGSIGTALARETGRRFLLTQLLLAYANHKFQLRGHGQRAVVFFSPQPPARQTELNDCISDAFYRTLFMSPCLSGWDRGEAKSEYMALCHEVLSRSRLNAVAKLRDAGIITRNLVVLPTLSNTSLSNNGVHVSLGSRLLSDARREEASGFAAADEKRFADLTVKIAEHFLPLFVGTYSAAPFRVDFAKFHPEALLGFLPHQLDFTHLRLLWRQWKKKARIRVFGRPITPMGPDWLDRLLARLLRLRGDVVEDLRLLDFPVALLSTATSPGLDGTLGNQTRLLRDLDEQGVFDRRMAFYLPFRPREFGRAGYCGFEARFYSLFPSIRTDMSRAVDLQALITTLAARLAMRGVIRPEDLPDDPTVESERRQFLFAAAAGVPHGFVRLDSPARFLHRILARSPKVRPSRRHGGYLRVKLTGYLRGLMTVIRETGADLVTDAGMEGALDDLEGRIAGGPPYAASRTLTNGILGEAGARRPFDLSAAEFNAAAERYYRDALRRRHVSEAWADFRDWAISIDREASVPDRDALERMCGGESVTTFLDRRAADAASEELPAEETRKLILLTLLWERAERPA
jgi:hypothetical protein